MTHELQSLHKPHTETAILQMEQTGQKVGGLFVTRYIASLIGIWLALLTPLSVTIAIRVGQIDPAGKATSLALVASVGAAASLFANPIFGALSDRSTSRFGQRRPFILGGVSVGALAVIGVGFAPNIWLVAVMWAIAQTAFNAAIAATIAILPERVPSKLRGRVSGFMGMTTQVGVVGGVFMSQLLGTQGAAMFIAPAVVGVLLVLPFALTLREVPKTKNEVPRTSILTIFAAFWINPLKNRDFALAWIGRFFVWIALYLLTTYKTYFLIDHLGYNTSNVAPILTIAMFVLAVCIAASSIPGGWLSDKLNRRKPFVVTAALLFVVAMTIVAFSTTVEMFILGIAIAGLANGLYLGVDYALVAQVLPNVGSEAAKGMGVFNLSSTIPQTIAPIIAPMLLTIAATPGSGNYTSLYLCAAVLALIGAGFTQMLRSIH
ncbi:MFS transporter [Paenarthrobacter sp. NPDC089714]|uniref:MFS transporter n=1 Tax=Paenarthrobacter sp. NPDC089714 TaxID=3364377 RepID=UPI0037F12F7B